MQFEMHSFFVQHCLAPIYKCCFLIDLEKKTTNQHFNDPPSKNTPLLFSVNVSNITGSLKFTSRFKVALRAGFAVQESFLFSFFLGWWREGVSISIHLSFIIVWIMIYGSRALSIPAPARIWCLSPHCVSLSSCLMGKHLVSEAKEIEALLHLILLKRMKTGAKRPDSVCQRQH